MMFYNRFSVRVVGGKEDHSGYIRMRDGQQFKLSLRNEWDDPCDAEVKLNGASVGKYRLRAHGTLVLERSAQDDGCFTFFSAGSMGGKQAGADGINPEMRGLIQVEFTPGKERVKWTYSAWCPCPPWNHPRPVEPDYYYTYTLESPSTFTMRGGGGTSSSCSCHLSQSAPTAGGEGIAGLSGHSEQQFYGVDDLNYDYSRQTTISLRLVEDLGGPDAVDARPIVSHGNPVPPPVR